MEVALLKVGFDMHFVKPLMGCVDDPALAVLVNESPSNLFKSKIGLHQGNPFVSILFHYWSQGHKAAQITGIFLP